MFCPKCGNSILGVTRFCPQCSAELDSSSSRPGKHARGFTHLIVGMFLLAAAFALATLVFIRPDSNAKKVPPPAPAKSIPHVSEVKPVKGNDNEPKSSGELIHPYDLVKNPFRDQGKMVTLVSLPFPILVNGVLVGYQSLGSNAAAASGIEGLHFNRMLSDDTCLFDVMAMDNSDYRDPEIVGQLAVVIKPGAQAPDDTRNWKAEPISTLQGTNAFGAVIEVPAVRFWGFGEADAAKRTDGFVPPTGKALDAVNLVRSQVKPTAALLAEDPDLRHIEWSALDNSMVCNGCWSVSAHIQIHSSDADPVQYFENPGWEVNLDNRAVKPDPDAVRFYASTPPEEP